MSNCSKQLAGINLVLTFDKVWLSFMLWYPYITFSKVWTSRVIAFTGPVSTYNHIYLATFVTLEEVSQRRKTRSGRSTRSLERYSTCNPDNSGQWKSYRTIIGESKDCKPKTHLLSYFFCRLLLILSCIQNLTLLPLEQEISHGYSSESIPHVSEYDNDKTKAFTSRVKRC